MELVEDGEGGASGRDGGVDKEAAFEGEDGAPGSVRPVGWGIGKAAVILECVFERSHCVGSLVYLSLNTKLRTDIRSSSEVPPLTILHPTCAMKKPATPTKKHMAINLKFGATRLDVIFLS